MQRSVYRLLKSPLICHLKTDLQIILSKAVATQINHFISSIEKPFVNDVMTEMRKA